VEQARSQQNSIFFYCPKHITIEVNGCGLMNCQSTHDFDVHNDFLDMQ
jgi:hypothetical protein